MGERGSESELRMALAQMGVLAGGFVWGLLAAHAFLLIELDLASEIERAHELGIVSLTILSGYPKGHDMLSYLATLILPVIGGVGFWWVWSRGRHERLREWVEPAGDPPRRDRGWRLTGIVLGLVFLLASFNLSRLHAPAWNHLVGAWVFLGEEGVILAWAQSILQGGVYGKDFFCMYGPMMIYPLIWVMELLGPSVMAERGLKLGFDLLAHGIVLLWLYRVCRSRASFVLFSLTYLLLFPTFRTISLNFTYLRVVLGLGPILLFALYLERPRTPLLVLAGGVLGQSLLFSQEVGGAAGVALAVALGLQATLVQDWKGIWARGGWLVAGLLISVAPMLLYLAAHGALGFFLDSLWGYPALAMRGSLALWAPEFAAFWAQPFGEEFRYYWVILMYASTAVYLLPRFLLGRANRNDVLAATLIVFGVLIFTVAARRYTAGNVSKIWLPALLLLFMMLERSAQDFFQRRGPMRYAPLACAVGWLASFGLVGVSSAFVRSTVGSAIPVYLQDKWTRLAVGVELPGLERADGIGVDPETASAVQRIGRFLEIHTSAREPVYFFPNEPLYYFLFDRQNPTRFATSYHAVTAAQRLELITHLEEKQPRFVFYSQHTWRVDNIPEQLQVPEVVRYLEEHYRLHTDLGGILVLERS